MSEIDDLYKQEAEEIDTAFLEEVKTGKNREKSILNYRMKLKKSRKKFSKDYVKFNVRESRRIRKIKKKLEKDPTFKHLEIAHFDFEFGFWRKVWIRLDVSFFRFMRIVRRFFTWVFPSWFIYGWYKVRNFFRYTWRDLNEYVGLKLGGVKDFFVKSGIFLWGIVSGLWKKMKILIIGVLDWIGTKMGNKKTDEDKEKKKEGIKEKTEKTD